MASVGFAPEAKRAAAVPAFAARSSKTGYLLKRNKMKVWEKRWFVLDAGELSYYRSFEQYKRQKDGDYSHPVPCCARVKRRGSRMSTEAEVHHQLSAVMEEDEEEVDHDIDFVVLVDGKKTLLRASSPDEKKAWVVAMNSAKLVRSYSSKQLTLGDRPPVSWPDLTLSDLDIGEILGSGTTGAVKLAVHIPTGMKCAVKIIAKRKFFFNKQLEESTKREIEILNQMREMNHKNIVKCFGHIDDPGYIYIAMELCEGGELLEQLEHLGKYTEEDTSEVIRNLVSTLEYLHGAGIVHRDIKPENLLLADSTDLCNVKVADFGLANVLDGDNAQTNTVCGSPAYMAPEVQSGGMYSGACDLWSVGVMMYLMLSGKLPFQGADSAQKMADEEYDFDDVIWDAVSDEAKDVVNGLLTADPEQRMTAQQALANPWVTGETAGHVWLEEAQRKITLFNGKRKFKGMTHAIVASNRMRMLMAGLNAAAHEEEAADPKLRPTGGGGNGKSVSKTRSVDFDTGMAQKNGSVGFDNPIAEGADSPVDSSSPVRLGSGRVKSAIRSPSIRRQASMDLRDSMMMNSQDT
eukprot:SAG22_NODE_123_length_18914_cov_28.993410_9_plen_576_part_00